MTTTEASIIAREILARIHANTDILCDNWGEHDDNIDNIVFGHIHDVLVAHDLDNR